MSVASATIPRDPVLPPWFGKDHWSTFAYIEICCVDRNGVASRDRMRTDPDVHAGLYGTTRRSISLLPSRKYPTRLKSPATGKPVLLDDHDDWSCMEDCIAAGLAVDLGTGINPLYKLTELGHKVAAALRKHKANGKSFHHFEWSPSEVSGG